MQAAIRTTTAARVNLRAATMATPGVKQRGTIMEPYDPLGKLGELLSKQGTSSGLPETAPGLPPTNPRCPAVTVPLREQCAIRVPS